MKDSQNPPARFLCPVCASAGKGDRGSLPTSCRACGAYPTTSGSGHESLCPRDGEVHYAVH